PYTTLFRSDHRGGVGQHPFADADQVGPGLHLQALGQLGAGPQGLDLDAVGMGIAAERTDQGIVFQLLVQAAAQGQHRPVDHRADAPHPLHIAGALHGAEGVPDDGAADAQLSGKVQLGGQAVGPGPAAGAQFFQQLGDHPVADDPAAQVDGVVGGGSSRHGNAFLSPFRGERVRVVCIQYTTTPASCLDWSGRVPGVEADDVQDHLGGLVHPLGGDALQHAVEVEAAGAQVGAGQALPAEDGAVGAAPDGHFLRLQPGGPDGGAGGLHQVEVGADLFDHVAVAVLQLHRDGAGAVLAVEPGGGLEQVVLFVFQLGGVVIPQDIAQLGLGDV